MRLQTRVAAVASLLLGVVAGVRVGPTRADAPQQRVQVLRRRLAGTRWPSPAPERGWEQGTDLAYLRELVGYWLGGFDLRAQERRLNQLDHFVTEVDGQRVHFVHARSRHAQALPLVLSHGWPGSIVEFLDVFGPLTDPPDPSDAFHVVAPSLPGYGFSGPVSEPGWHPRRMAQAFTVLMDWLGYARYGVQGGDWGSLVSQNMATSRPTGWRACTSTSSPFPGREESVPGSSIPRSGPAWSG